MYCKAIEHIRLAICLNEIRKVAEPGAIVYFKHRSFFSTRGASIWHHGNPWGHLLLNDEEFAEYAKTFHPERSQKMVDFFFVSLLSKDDRADMVRIASACDLKLESIR